MTEMIAHDALARISALKDGIRTPAMLFLDDYPYPEGAAAIGPGRTIDFRDFPEVRYPASVSVLNDITGEGAYGAIYLRGNEVELSHKGAEIYWFPHIAELLGDPRRLVDACIGARELAGTSPLIYAPGTGRPNHMALLAYLGIDIFDSIPLVTASRRGTYLDENGEWKSPLDFDALLKENEGSALRELKVVRRAIEERRLRDIVEMRSRSEPWLYAALRLADEEHREFFERHSSLKPKKVMYSGPESIERPEVMRFRKRVLERWRPKGGVLLLLPCSSRKPYSRSRTHRKIGDILHSIGGWGAVQELIITSPLIAVPRELERYYPAGHYDAAVRGKWDAQEIEAINEALNTIKRSGSFRHVIIHLPEDMEFVSEAVYGEWTVKGSPTSSESLRNLRVALEGALSDVRKESAGKRALWTLQSMVEYQFGIEGREMVDTAKGRWPEIKGFKDGKQTVSFVERKSSLSITGEGGKILAEKGIYRVFISDFEIKGDIFSVGVEGADPEIREGDDVVIVRKDEPAAVGIAEKSASEMVESRRGLAVRVRKKIR